MINPSKKTRIKKFISNLLDLGIPIKQSQPIADLVVKIASYEIGVREVGGNNKGTRIQEYQSSTWLEGTGWPWCAAFVCWVIKQALATGLNVTWKRPMTAGAFDLVRWAKEQNLTILDNKSKAKKGDIVVFDFSHTGIVSKDQEGDFIETIEGNTNGKGERDSDTGDGVWEKKRHKSLIHKLIRLY